MIDLVQPLPCGKIFNVRGLPDSISVPDLNTGQWRYYRFNVTDNNVSPSVCDCVFQVTNGTGALPEPFLHVVIFTDANNFTHWDLWTIENVDYWTVNTNINEVTCVFTCSDMVSSTSGANLTIRFSTNETVWFQDWKDTITVDARTLKAGTTLFKIKAKSSKSTRAFIYQITNFSPFGSRFLTIDNKNGKISASQDFIFFDTGKGSSMQMVVKSYDEADKMGIYRGLEIILIGQNHCPSMVNLLTKQKITKLETLVADDIIFNGSCEDADNDVEPLSAISSCVPSPCESIFVMDISGQLMLATGQSLNYETVPSYEFELTCEDQCMTTGPYTLDLIVGNDNDAPVCPIDMYYFTVYSGQTSFWDPGLTCTDEDQGELLTWELDAANSSSRFTLTSANEMSLDVPYVIGDNTADLSRPHGQLYRQWRALGRQENLYHTDYN